MSHIPSHVTRQTPLPTLGGEKKVQTEQMNPSKTSRSSQSRTRREGRKEGNQQRRRPESDMAPPRPTKKRRTDVAPTNAPALAGPIGNIRALQSAMADYSGAGLKAVKDFLFRCSKGPEVEELEAAANRSILKQYLETQTKEAQKESDDAEKESSAFAEVVQIWSYANQNNSINLLSLVPATMANLVRICSYHEEEFKNYGTILIKSLLQPTTLKIIYRGLTGNKDKVVSPCLRLLTEMNRFNFGAMCGFVHSTIDFTIKDLPRNLEVKGGAKATVEEIGRPSVRTQFLRFFLSFLQNGEPSVRNEMMGLRSWITPIFKHLKTDTPEIINDLLTCFTTRVLDEKEIPRATKTNAFNEWILAHILELYTREETVKTSNAGKDIEKPLADIAHEFLMSVCTKRGSGACFPDHGWYPPGHMADEEKRKSAPKVFNRILSSLLTHIRPYASTMQLDLMLDILKTCPELVADYFLSNWSFSFDPKLTSTWIGYCTFLHSTITLPIPENFGAPEAQILPPPTNVIVENVLPKPLTKAIMSKCLTHENNFIRFLATRLLISAFQKLRSVLKALDEAAGSVHDPTETWKRCRFDVIEEFCKRIPDASVVSNIAGKTSGVLQTEARMRLLAEYYTTIPELALSGNYDVNVALSNFLGNEFEDQKGMKQLEMGHLLQIATEVPDVKWWNKTPAMKHSPFVAILKRCCSTATNTSQRQVRTLLHSFASTSYLFQAETSASPLDALLESLSTLEDSGDLEAILSLLDEVVARCIRGPFKYLDDYAELAAEIQKQKPEASNFAPVSPLVMTLVEQWKFFMQSKDHSSQQKLGGVRWLLRLLESCAVLGENRFVLAVLCDRVASSGSTDESIPKLKNYLQEGDQGLEIAPNGGREYDSAVGVRDMFTRFPNRRIDVQMIALLSDGVLHRRIEPSLFDLAVVQRAITEVAESRNISTSKAAAVITQLNELMKIRRIALYRLRTE
ncbi:ribosome 60S biogenesis N-terminal-domain-containing protein [Tricharina praecox]|uniref:ribosome 60S biogenesis N-terminal-domain-containing protein n=1 Tax=Tricharina praecox TaxID=43433 RepID=UPI002220B4B6|nr:ribosome 60S biogenesis N-terminal-domain-containing protein [Tricharina praecox]KAI5849195.1 ribosome 60S biogenesis N-terminal-domain-containing protein [Tricharina praecox]